MNSLVSVTDHVIDNLDFFRLQDILISERSSASLPSERLDRDWSLTVMPVTIHDKRPVISVTGHSL